MDNFRKKFQSIIGAVRKGTMKYFKRQEKIHGNSTTRRQPAPCHTADDRRLMRHGNPKPNIVGQYTHSLFIYIRRCLFSRAARRLNLVYSLQDRKSFG